MTARTRNVALGLTLLILLAPVAPVAAGADDGSDVVPRILKLLSPAERQANLRLLQERWRDASTRSAPAAFSTVRTS